MKSNNFFINVHFVISVYTWKHANQYSWQEKWKGGEWCRGGFRPKHTTSKPQKQKNPSRKSKKAPTETKYLSNINQKIDFALFVENKPAPEHNVCLQVMEGGQEVLKVRTKT